MELSAGRLGRQTYRDRSVSPRTELPHILRRDSGRQAPSITGEVVHTGLTFAFKCESLAFHVMH